MEHTSFHTFFQVPGVPGMWRERRPCLSPLLRVTQRLAKEQECKNGQSCIAPCIHTLCNMTWQLRSSRDSACSPLLEPGMATDLFLARRMQQRWLHANAEASSPESMQGCVLGALEPCPTATLTSRSGLLGEETRGPVSLQLQLTHTQELHRRVKPPQAGRAHQEAQPRSAGLPS